MNYEEMLSKAYSELPEIRVSKQRFEIPQIVSNISGNITSINNFLSISDYLSRLPSHLLKFFIRELATQGSFSGTKASFTGKFQTHRLQGVLQNYVKEFVVCKQCGHADTKIVKEDRINFITCMACNAKYPLRNIK